jgi:KDO2-lipid IV(A) lauroyltransferase
MLRRFAERVSYLWVWFVLKTGEALIRIFPRHFFLSLSEILGDLCFDLFYSFRKRSVRNLTLALGDRLDPSTVERTARRSLRNFFRDFVEIGFALEGSMEEVREDISLIGREHLKKALAKGRGVIALSAHFGNFFLLGTRLAAEGYPVSVLVKPSHNGRFANLMDHYRLRVKQRTIRTRPAREATRQLIQLLRRNELAVVLADEFRSKGIAVPFFGRLVLARRGPVTLAMRTGAAVVPVYLIRDQNDRLILVIEPELKLSRHRHLTEDVASNTLRITAWLESVVRAYPDQWNWMTIRWQETPRDMSHRKEIRNERFA